MKDLYARLNVPPSASEDELAAALEKCPGMQSVTPILLDRNKRARYDRAHTTLKSIGVLRHHLRLDTGESWFRDNCPDFVPGHKPARTPAEPRAGTSAAPPAREPGATAPRAQANPAPPPRTARSVPLAGLIAAAVLLALAALYILVLK
jgi:hypothetical protein